MQKSAWTALRGRMEISRPRARLFLAAQRNPNAEGEVPVNLRHGPETSMHRVSGCPTVFANDKAD